MTDSARVLIVDDEPDLLELLELTLGRMGLEVDTAVCLDEARGLLARHQYGLCFTDMRLPDGDGLELVGEIGEQHPNTAVAVITAYGSTETAVSALKAGAFDFVSKPVELAHLRDMVGHALRLPASEPSSHKAESQQAKRSLEAMAQERLKGDSDALKQARAMIVKLSRSQAPVFISGESGVGKEVAARLIHQLGPRADGPFVAVNCGAVPTELMESEFFGHVKGAFTGASSDREGLFRSAAGGTLFLDEVADLPLHMQVKLLRAIQEKVVRPVGAAKEIAVDVRLLSASHKNLAQETDRGRFRQDLYYRINVIELHMPPLRERREDILPLARFLLNRLSERWEMPAPELSRAASEALMAHDFPGNVRELENTLERAMTLAEERLIEVDDLRLGNGRSESGPTDTATRPPDMDLESWLAVQERRAILDALQTADNNKTRAAELLGITFRALRYKLDKHDID